MRTSERSELEFAKLEHTNPVAAAEFADLYLRFQTDPRSIGRRFRFDDPAVEHWVYESPRVPRRPAIRIYYTIVGRVVSIEAVGVR